MGDRANIYIKDQYNDGGVFLYGHWSGTTVCPAVQATLKRKARWNDGAYLARMMFDALTEGCHGDETGFGISAGISDNEYPIVMVNVAGQTVSLGTETVPPLPYDGFSWSFAEFADLALTDDGWPASMPQEPHWRDWAKPAPARDEG